MCDPATLQPVVSGILHRKKKKILTYAVVLLQTWTLTRKVLANPRSVVNLHINSSVLKEQFKAGTVQVGEPSWLCNIENMILGKQLFWITYIDECRSGDLSFILGLCPLLNLRNWNTYATKAHLFLITTARTRDQIATLIMFLSDICFHSSLLSLLASSFISSFDLKLKPNLKGKHTTALIVEFLAIQGVPDYSPCFEHKDEKWQKWATSWVFGRESVGRENIRLRLSKRVGHFIKEKWFHCWKVIFFNEWNYLESLDNGRDRVAN